MKLMRWFRRKKSKIIAVIVICLMLTLGAGTFLSQLGRRRGPSPKDVAAYFGDNKKITNKDLVQAYQELQVLRMLQTDRLLRSIPEQIARAPDLQALLLGELLFSDRQISPAVINRIKQAVGANRYRISDKQIYDIYRRPMPSNIYWLLLKKEAELAGIALTNEYTGRYLAESIPQITDGRTYSQIVGPIVNPPPRANWQGVPENEILTTFGKLLAVLRYARIVCSGEAATIQQVMHNVSQEGETIDVELVRLDSSVFAEEQEEPTEQAVLAHFEKYKKFFAGSISKENPCGFGYKLDDRIQLEYIVVKLEDILGIVAAPTQEDAEEYYLRNRKQFTVPVAPDQNNPDSPTERIRSYAEVAGNISTMLLRNKIESKAVQILQEAEGLTEASSEDADMEVANGTPNATQGVSEPNLGAEEPEAIAGDYEIAAEELSEKYKVKVYAGQTGLLSATDMQTDEYLGRLYVRGHGDTVVGLTQVVFAIDELEASELGPFDVSKPRMYENIGPARDIRGQIAGDVTGQIMAVLRVIRAEKASELESIDHTFSKSTLDLTQSNEEDPNQNKETTGAENVYSVKEKVVEDLKKLAAMGTAKTKAEEFIKQAGEDSWEDAVDKFNELYGEADEDANDPNSVRPEESTDSVDKPFSLQSLTNLPRRSSTNLDTLAMRSASHPAGRFNVDVAKKEAELLDRLYSLVPQDSNTVDNLPVVLEFEPDMSFYVIKGLSVSRINRNEYETIKALQVYREELVQSQSLAAVHYNPENILERMNFKQIEEDEEAADANAPGPAEGAS